MQQQQQTEIASLALQAGSDVLLELTRAEVVTFGGWRTNTVGSQWCRTSEYSFKQFYQTLH